MHRTVTIIATLGIIIAGAGAFFISVNTYTSSPGFTTREQAEAFEETKPTCYGISILRNADAVASDAPGISTCIGYLDR